MQLRYDTGTLPSSVSIELRTEDMRRNNWSIVVPIFAIVLIGLLCIVAAAVSWGWLHPDPPTDVSNSETLRNVGLLIGGVVAFAFALWRAWIAALQVHASQEQVDTAQRTLVNDQYQRGTEMLFSEMLAVRLAGIHELETLGKQQPETYHLRIMGLFCAFAKSPPKDEILDTPDVFDGEEMPLPVRADVQAALSAVGLRDRTHLQLESEKGFKIDLRGVNLRRGVFRQCLFDHADLTWADLSHANLEGASLVDADLAFADLSLADMSEAVCSESICRLTRMSGVKAHRTNFTGANLEGAIGNGAELESALLVGATLRGADLTNAILAGTDISGTKFGMGGQRDEIYDQGLRGISRRNAYTSLTQGQLDQATACFDCPPEIEPGTNDTVTGAQLVWTVPLRCR